MGNALGKKMSDIGNGQGRNRKSGMINGYCMRKKCGVMLMQGETVCPACGEKINEKT
jgi:hypothetical protein